MKQTDQERKGIDWAKWLVYAVVLGIIGALYAPLSARAGEQKESAQGIALGGILCDHAEELVEMFQAIYESLTIKAPLVAKRSYNKIGVGGLNFISNVL